jgi:hypothetical protein
MLKVPPSAIALFSVFLYGCYNAIFAYLTNIKEVSILQLLAVQKVRRFLERGRMRSDDLASLIHLVCCVYWYHWHTVRIIRSSRVAYGDMGNCGPSHPWNTIVDGYPSTAYLV